MEWTFAQMREARRIIRKNAALFAAELVVDGREITFDEVESILRTILLCGVTYKDLVDQARDWDEQRARYGRVS